MQNRLPSAGAPRQTEQADQAARFVLEQIEAREGRCAYQGRWPTPLAACEALPGSLRVMAEQRIRHVPRAVAQALMLWAQGADVALYDHVPRPEQVLELQSRGARCVSLLPPQVSAAPHADALAFVLHDLCHLEKFLDPVHHVGQVGFFSMVVEARRRPAFGTFERDFDAELSREWDHVISDMNGSAVFLFAAMKMKLKMAVRRRMAQRQGTQAPQLGPLSARENEAYEDAQRQLLELLDLAGELAGAARATSAKRAEPQAAGQLLAHFESLGRSALNASQTSWVAHEQTAPTIAAAT
jgi:hypothetical protein